MNPTSRQRDRALNAAEIVGGFCAICIVTCAMTAIAVVGWCLKKILTLLGVLK